MHGSDQSGVYERFKEHGRDGLPRPERYPELLELRARLRAPRPHVRTQRVMEHARASVLGLGMVGVLHPAQPPVELHQRPGSTRLPAHTRNEASPRAHLCVDRPHLPAAPQPRQLGLLPRAGHATRLCRRQRAFVSCRSAAGHGSDHLEPAPLLRHGPSGPPARRREAAVALLQGGGRGHASRGVMGGAQRTRQRASTGARQRRPGLRHLADQRGDERPRLEQHGDLPCVG